jgi:hypothetical protein
MKMPFANKIKDLFSFPKLYSDFYTTFGSGEEDF